MAVATNKKGCGQPDHVRIKYKARNRKGIPIGMWIRTEVKGGVFIREWAEENKWKS